MKSFLRAAAATGVAAATLAAGLSFGAAATAAPGTAPATTDKRATIEPGTDGARFELIGKATDGFAYIGEDGLRHIAGTLAEAEDNVFEFQAKFAEFDDGVGWWKLVALRDLPGEDSCLISGNNIVTLGRCSWEYPSVLWTIDDGVLKSKGSHQAVSAPTWLTTGPDSFYKDYFGTASTRPVIKPEFIGLPSTLVGLSADVDAVDLEAGTAQLVDGVAPDEASSVAVSYEDKNGTTVERDETVTDGKWSASLRNLKLGVTTVHLTAYDGADVIAENDIEVDLPVTPLTAEATFATELDEVATISGTATGETEVKVFHGEKQIASTTSKTDGSYSIRVNAPNMAGTYDLTVTQTIRGEDTTPKELSIDYGIGVSITSPAQGVELQPGDQLAITGAAQKKSRIRVYEKGEPGTILGEATAGTTADTYRVVLRDLQDREYQLVVDGLSKGYNYTTAELSVNPGKSVIAPIEASVEFPGALTDDAHVVGTAEQDADITIRNGDDEIATGTANGDGDFDIAIPSQGPGEHTLTLTETTGDATKSAEIRADFGAAVAATVEGGATIAGSTATITGTGSAEAKIVITEGSKKLAETTVTGGGSFSVPVEEIQDGQHDYVVTQTAKGNTTSTADVSVTRNAPVTPVGLTSPQSGDSYPAKSTVRFTGTGTPGATVLLDAFAGLADYSTTVDWDGSWTIDRPMNIGTYRFDIVQTAKGQESRVDGVELVEEGTPVDRPFAVTAPESGSTHKDEVVEFTGTGTPESTITLDPKVAGLSTVTTTVQTNGTWSVNRYLGAGAYSFDVYQTTDGKETGRTNVEVNQPASVDRPFAVTSPEDGSEHRNEAVTFAGTGTAHAEIVVHVSNFPATDVTTTVGADGRWSVKRWLGDGPYVLDVTQKSNGLPSGSTTLHLNNSATPIDKPFTITSHTDGGTFTPDQAETFRGTGAAGATITIDPGAGLAKVTTTVEGNGDWAVSKWLGNGSYTFTVSQTDGDDTTTLAPFTITPAK